MIHLEPITRINCQACREWRNKYRFALRTPLILTKEMQDDFYDRISHDRKSEDRYWEIHKDRGFPTFLGLGGLTSWEPENRIAEISLFLDPTMVRGARADPDRNPHWGTRAADLLCQEGFLRMGLKTICGEAFTCNPHHKFWLALTERIDGYWTFLPARKFWNGKFHDSVYFSWDAEGYATKSLFKAEDIIN